MVVLGILIALQFNNWNEEKKEAVQANKLLKNLKDEIKQDSTYFTDVYKFEKELLLRSAQILFKAHTQDETYKEYDSILGISFRYASFVPVIKYSNNAYKELTASKLLEHIDSSELRQSFFEYYGQIHFLEKYAESSDIIAINLGNELAEYYVIIPDKKYKKDTTAFFAGAGEEEFSANYDLAAFREKKSLNSKLYDMIDIHKDRLSNISIILDLNQRILSGINYELKD